MQTRSKQTTGNIIFLVGIFLALGLAVAAVWGDFEAVSYFYSGAGYDAFSALKCPILISRSEVAPVSARLDNPSDQVIEPYYEVEISGTAASRGLEDQVPVPPHTSRTVQWTVDANDIDLGYFIFIKMDILPVGKYSTREATCGILVANVAGLTGGQIFGWSLAVSLLGLVIGLGLRESGNERVAGRALSLRNGLRAAGVAASLAMLTGFSGSWLIGLLLSAITVLLLVILLRFAGE